MNSQLQCERCGATWVGSSGNERSLFCVGCGVPTSQVELGTSCCKEEYTERFSTTVLRAVWNWLYVTSLLVALILGIFLMLVGALLLASLVAGKPPAVFGLNGGPQAVIGLLMFAGIAFGFFSIVSLPMSLYLAARTTRWQVVGYKKYLLVRSRASDVYVPLSEVTWHRNRWATDGYIYFLPTHDWIVVRHQEGWSFVLGATEVACATWIAFFENQRVPYRAGVKVWEWFAVPAVGALWGGVYGAGMSMPLWWLTHDIQWVTTLVFIGAGDGAAYRLYKFMIYRGYYERLDSTQSIWLGVLGFVIVGLKGARLSGMAGLGTYLCGLLNGVVGWFVSSHCNRLATSARAYGTNPDDHSKNAGSNFG